MTEGAGVLECSDVGGGGRVQHRAGWFEDVASQISHIGGASDRGRLDSDSALMWWFGQWVLADGARGCQVHSSHQGDL